MHMRFYIKLEHVTFAVCCIPYSCTLCTSIMDQPWVPGMQLQQQPLYRLVQYFTYWPMFGSFNNWNIIQLSHKATSSGDIDKNHQVVLDGIS